MTMRQIPVTILTGFLGSGKTTLLNRILASGLSDTGVIVNEFGSVGLDDLLIKGASGDVVLLPDGCACCTMRNGLVPALMALARHSVEGKLALKRIIIETSGICDPTPIMHLLMIDPTLFDHCYLDGVITVVDAFAEDMLDRHDEMAIQIASADHLCISKTDLAPHKTVRTLRRRLAQYNAGAIVSDTQAASFTPDILFGLSHAKRTAAGKNISRWLCHEAVAGKSDPAASQDAESSRDANAIAHARYHSFAISLSAATTWDALTDWMDVVANAYGQDILRVKAIVATTDWPDHPVVVHGVRQLFHPPIRLPEWPTDDRRSRFIFIVSGVTQEKIEQSLTMLGPGAER